MVAHALMDHAYIDENRVPDGFLRHTLLPAVREAFVSHLLRCEECRDRVLLAEMFLDSVEAAQPVPPVQVVQVPVEPVPFSLDSASTLEIPADVLPLPKPVEPAPALKSAAARGLLKTRPLKPVTYAPREYRFLSKLDPWEMRMLLFLVSILLAIFIPVAVVVFIYEH